MRQKFPSWSYTACDDTSDSETKSAFQKKKNSIIKLLKGTQLNQFQGCCIIKVINMNFMHICMKRKPTFTNM